jgi:RES domain-containing protein
MPEFDAGLLAAAPATGFTGTAYRNQAPGFDPISAEGARRSGGRFNPPHRFPVVYLCGTTPCVVAELTAQATRQGLRLADLLPRELWSVPLSLTTVLDLGDAKIRRKLHLCDTRRSALPLRPTSTRSSPCSRKTWARPP